MPKAPSNSSKASSGKILLIRGSYIYGWAYARAQQAAVIEVCAHGVTLATAIADITLPGELGVPPEHAERGFVVYIEEAILAERPHLTIRIANTDIELSARSIRHNAAPRHTEPPTIGYCENHEGLRIWGWIVPFNKVRQSQIYALEGGEIVAQTTAQGPSPAAQRLGVGPNALAFDLTLPARFADGKPHSIFLMDDKKRLFGRKLSVHSPPLDAQPWLDRLSIPQGDRELLNRLLAQSRQWVPKSIGFKAFADWHAAFFGTTQTTQDGIELIAYTHQTTVADALTQIKANKNASLIIFYPNDCTLLGPPTHRLKESFAQSSVELAYFDSIENDSNPLPRLHGQWDALYALAKPDLLDTFAIRVSTLKKYKALSAQDLPWQVAADVHATSPTAAAAREKIIHVPSIAIATPTRLVKRLHQGFLEFSKRVAHLEKVSVPAPLQTSHQSPVITWKRPRLLPPVTIVIPTRDHFEELSQCMGSLAKTRYPGLKILVVDNQTAEPEALAYLKTLPKRNVRVVRWPKPFNYAQLHNDIVPEVDTELVCLLNNDIVIQDPEWLTEMVTQLTPTVGAVGAKLLWPNEMVQHAGVVLGRSGLVDHIGTGWSATDSGYEALANITREVSAVTAACMLLRTCEFVALGGFRAKDFPICFNDVDLCLRIRHELNKSIVVSTKATLLHKESVSRGSDQSTAARARLGREMARLTALWGEALFNDMFYSPHLNLDGPSHMGLAVPPRLPEFLQKPAARSVNLNR